MLWLYAISLGNAPTINAHEVTGAWPGPGNLNLALDGGPTVGNETFSPGKSARLTLPAHFNLRAHGGSGARMPPSPGNWIRPKFPGRLT
jgi:hypothetical protein